MIVKDIIAEDFVNYKKPSMFIIMPYCSFKCDKECGENVCQNSSVASLPDIEVDIDELLMDYIRNPITDAVVFGGLEPFDSWEELIEFISVFRWVLDDDIVIYTGYNKDEIQDKIDLLKQYENIIIKFGRFIPNQNSHYDDVLGVELASNNQYAEVIVNENTK